MIEASGMNDSNANQTYIHTGLVHGVEGPEFAFRRIFADHPIHSLLDVGCGTGTWLRAASTCGVTDLKGIDGHDFKEDQLHCPFDAFQRVDLNKEWNLNRKFDAALCLEVAEHLEESTAGTLIGCLTRHADLIIFSAACPGQPGQQHINCQWPSYWQKLFNEHGFVCTDDLRWRIWDDERIESWYRQNIFVARHDPDSAGSEPRIAAVIHPAMFTTLMTCAVQASFDQAALEGHRSPSWYLKTFVIGGTRKLKAFVTKLIGGSSKQA